MRKANENDSNSSFPDLMLILLTMWNQNNKASNSVWSNPSFGSLISNGGDGEDTKPS